jgi:hypothetical protein
MYPALQGVIISGQVFAHTSILSIFACPGRSRQNHVGCRLGDSGYYFAFSIDKLSDMMFRYMPHPERNSWLAGSGVCLEARKR